MPGRSDYRFPNEVDGSLRSSAVVSSIHPSVVPAVLPFYKADTLDAQTTIDNGSRIFTVVEILKEVFHEDFHKAISRYMAECPEGVAKALGVQTVDDARLILLSEPKVESSLDQPACATAVDLLFSAIVEVSVPWTMPIPMSDCGSSKDAGDKGDTATVITQAPQTSRHRIEFRTVCSRLVPMLPVVLVHIQQYSSIPWKSWQTLNV